MINRIFPSREEISNQRQQLQEGERFLLEFLDQNLKKDKDFEKNMNLSDYKWWLIFSQPYINNCKPDVILFNPQVGMQIIEVKDRNLNNYFFEEWKLKVRSKTWEYNIKSPLDQVEYYKNKILSEVMPIIWEDMSKEKKAFGIIKTSLYFHNASTDNAKKLFNIFWDNKFKNGLICGRDGLKKENLGNIVPDSDRNYSFYRRKKYNDDILYTFIPPFHFKEQWTDIVLNSDQKKIFWLEKWHHRIRWVAGGWKTLTLAQKVWELASQNKDILVLSYNITLENYIKDMVSRSKFEFDRNKINLNHFHWFCSDILNDLWEERPKDQSDDKAYMKYFFQKKIPAIVSQALKKNWDNHKKYDAIIIDEWQDFCIEWYNLLCEFLKDQDDYFMIFCDKKQNIYDVELDRLDKRKRNGTENFGNRNELKTIIRMPHKIANLTESFLERFDIDDDIKIKKIEPNLFWENDPHIIWINTEWDFLRDINRALITIKQKATSKHNSDTVILVTNNIEWMYCVKFFEEKNIATNNMFCEKEKKKAFWMWDWRLKISTIHSYKWRESKNVILYIWPMNTIDYRHLDKIIYIAITRTKENLIIINQEPRYKEFVEEMDKKWDID